MIDQSPYALLICLATDWSRNRIGYWLFPKHCNCPSTEPFRCRTGWRITLVGSRFTHAAESRYAPVEGEALAVADSLDKTRFSSLGCNDLIIAVNHCSKYSVTDPSKIFQIHDYAIGMKEPYVTNPE